METLSGIFEKNRIFRIPDYQRGYSWESKQLEDFWQDLENLQPNKFHYTGMVIIQEAKPEDISNWQEDKWLFEAKRNLKAYYIVDGQQRITTAIILISVLLNSIGEGEILENDEKSEIEQKYIVELNKRDRNQKSFIFGYEVDNPSFHFLKTKIFGYNIEGENQPETAYTNNLEAAKHFFERKIRAFSFEDKEELFRKLTNQLKFELSFLDEELDIFIVFETLNNRGKKLSQLETLKNRLIYLATLLEETDDNKEELRRLINDAWKDVYKYLGLNKDNPLDDDDFLRNHWIMYSGYDRTVADFYADEILKKTFTVNNTLSKSISDNDKITLDKIKKYVKSLREAVIGWYKIHNPYHALNLAKNTQNSNFKQELKLSKNEAFWLEKLNRLGFKFFTPIVLTSMVKRINENNRVALFQQIEAYNFLLFNVSYRRSNTGSYHFYAEANKLFEGNVSVPKITKDIEAWVYGEGSEKGYFDINNFLSHITELFQKTKQKEKGYARWRSLKYFMYEYELLLKSENTEPNLDRIKHPTASFIDYSHKYIIFPNSRAKVWKNSIWKTHREYKAFNLGNLVLSKTKPDANLNFESKKQEFQNGSYSEREIAQNYTEWTPETILDRGNKLLAFLEKRWKVSIAERDKNKLLFMDKMK